MVQGRVVAAPSCAERLYRGKGRDGGGRGHYAHAKTTLRKRESLFLRGTHTHTQKKRRVKPTHRQQIQRLRIHQQQHTQQTHLATVPHLGCAGGSREQAAKWRRESPKKAGKVCVLNGSAFARR